MLIGLVSSCSSGDSDGADELQGAAGAPIAGVSSYMTNPEDNMLQTRAWTLPTEPSDPYLTYVAYGKDTTIAIAFTQNNAEPMMGSFFYSSEKWRTDIVIPSPATYYLYGYIPSSPAIKFGVTDLSEGKTSYSTGAIMTLNNVPSVVPNDLCVVIGAKEGADAEHDNGLRRGNFAYSAKAISASPKKDDGNYVFLLFDHLYAALRVYIRVQGDYAALRTIKLKSLWLNTLTDEGTTKEKTNITVKLTSNDGTTDPITEISYAPYGAVLDDGIKFWEDSKGKTLTTAYQEFTGHFMPSDVTTLVLTSVYDVYDRKGTLIRENCKATNTMVLREMLTEQYRTLRGSRYTINMTVNPTYLYVLSDPDLDSPTVTVD